jgi:hypothetical protein
MVELGEGLTKLRRVGLEKGPLHAFEREASAVLEFVYNTQLEHAACTLFLYHPTLHFSPCEWMMYHENWESVKFYLSSGLLMIPVSSSKTQSILVMLVWILLELAQLKKPGQLGIPQPAFRLPMFYPRAVDIMFRVVGADKNRMQCVLKGHHLLSFLAYGIKVEES